MRKKIEGQNPYAMKEKKNRLLYYFWGFPNDLVVKTLPANVGNTGDMGLIPWLVRFPRRGYGNTTPVFLQG